MDNSLQQLLLSGTKRQLARGQVFQSTDGKRVFNMIKSGYAKRYMIANNGNLSVQVLYGPGDIFPVTLMLEILFGQDLYEGPEVFYYEAMCPTEVYTIDDSTLIGAVAKDPTLYKYMLKEVGNRLHSTLNGIENVSMENAYHRIAHQLLYYSKQFSQINAKGEHKILIPLSHQDLANILSITRETTTISMGQLKARKLIRYKNKSITIPNIELLEKEAYSLD